MTKKMNLLILGSCGLEHTFALSALKSKKLRQLFMAPGNAGTAGVHHCTHLPIDPMNFPQVKNAILHHHIDAILVGSKTLLASGIMDFIKNDEKLNQVMTIGPPRAGAMITCDLPPAPDGSSGREVSMVIVINTLGDYIILPPSPMRDADEPFLQKVEERIIDPILSAVGPQKIPYAGFMQVRIVDIGGEPYFRDISVQLGDIETANIFPRIQTDFIDLISASASFMPDIELMIDPRPCATIMLTSSQRYKVITGLERLYGDDIVIIHYHTMKLPDGDIVNNGSPVAAITAFGESIQDARDQARVVAEQIHFDGKYYNRDIGNELIGETNNTP